MIMLGGGGREGGPTLKGAHGGSSPSPVLFNGLLNPLAES